MTTGWCFFFPDIPLGPNHQYVLIPYITWNNGQPKARIRKALTQEARDFREMVELLTGAAGFKVVKQKHYRLSVWVTYPNWRYDEDSTKLLQDSIFGARKDNRTVELHVYKSVRPGEKMTRVEIQECAEL